MAETERRGGRAGPAAAALDAGSWLRKGQGSAQVSRAGARCCSWQQYEGQPYTQGAAALCRERGRERERERTEGAQGALAGRRMLALMRDTAGGAKTSHARAQAAMQKTGRRVRLERSSGRLHREGTPRPAARRACSSRAQVRLLLPVQEQGQTRGLSRRGAAAQALQSGRLYTPSRAAELAGAIEEMAELAGPHKKGGLCSCKETAGSSHC